MGNASEKVLKYVLIGEDKSASKTMQGLGIAAAAAAAATVAFGIDSVKAFAGAEKSQRILDDAYARFPALADTNIDAMRDLAAAIQKKTGVDGDSINAAQGMIAAYGLTGEQVQRLTPLIVDFAQKTGRDMPTAAETLGKALMGQGRALKEVGIDFEDTGSVAGNLDQIMAGLRTQVGGFAEKEGASAEGKLAILTEKFGDVKENVGEQLMPVLDRFLDVLDTGATFVGENTTAVLIFAGGITVLSGGIAAVNAAQKAWNTVQEVTARLSKTNTTNLAAFARSIGPTTLAIGAAATAYGLYRTAQNNAREMTQSLADTLDRQTGSVTRNTAAWVESELTKPQSFGAFNTKSMAEAAEELGISLDTVTRAYMGQPAAVREAKAAAEEYLNQQNFINDTSLAHSSLAQRFIRNIDDQATRLENGAEIAKTAAEVNESLSGTTDGVASSAYDAAAAIEELGDESEETTSWFEDQAKALDELLTKQREAAGIKKTAMEAESALQEAIDGVSASVKENGQTLDLNTEQGRANQEAILKVAEAGWDNVEAMLAQDPSGKTARDAMARARDEFLKAASAAGMGADEANRLADELGLIPNSVTAIVMAKVADAQTNVDRFINTNNGRSVTVWVDAKGRQTGFVTALGVNRGFASGGYASPGWAMVGEQGPELVNFTQPGRVYTAGETRGMLGGGGGLTRADLDYLADRIGSNVLAGAAMVSQGTVSVDALAGRLAGRRI